MSDEPRPEIPAELWARVWQGQWWPCVARSMTVWFAPSGDAVLVGVSPARLAEAEAEIERLRSAIGRAVAKLAFVARLTGGFSRGSCGAGALADDLMAGLQLALNLKDSDHG